MEDLLGTGRHIAAASEHGSPQFVHSLPPSRAVSTHFGTGRMCSSARRSAYFDSDGEPLRLSPDGGLVRVWNFSELHAALAQVEERLLQDVAPASSTPLRKPISKSTDQSSEWIPHVVVVDSATQESLSKSTDIESGDAHSVARGSPDIPAISLVEDVMSLGKTDMSLGKLFELFSAAEESSPLSKPDNPSECGFAFVGRM